LGSLLRVHFLGSILSSIG